MGDLREQKRGLMAMRQTIPLRHVAAVVIGNGLEFYDFLSYAIFAVYIGKAFFPAHGSASLLLSLATFGIGFVTRPIGGIVLGGLGDRIGRKPAMLISFLLMGTGMLGLALTPTYAQIGIAAPILVVFFRLVQGFALGGEVGPTTAYLVEAAPPERRGLYGSMQYMSQDAGILVASLIGVTLSSLLSPEHLQSWGWRIAFLAGVVIVPFGVWLRRSLPETLHAADDAALAPDATTGQLGIRGNVSRHWKLIVLGLLLLTSTTIGAYVIDYMTTFALDTLHMTARIAFGVSVATSLCAVIFEPVSGLLSDRFGRKPVMIVPAIMILLLVIPGFWAITRFPSAFTLYGVMGAISILFSFATPPVIIAITESFPRAIRSGAVATVYAFAISIFGGSTQFVITGLIKWTGNSMSPAYYWAGALLLGLLAMLLIPESAPVRLRKLQPPVTLAAAIADPAATL